MFSCLHFFRKLHIYRNVLNKSHTQIKLPWTKKRHLHNVIFIGVSVKKLLEKLVYFCFRWGKELKFWQNI